MWHECACLYVYSAIKYGVFEKLGTYSFLFLVFPVFFVSHRKSQIEFITTFMKSNGLRLVIIVANCS